VGDAGPSALSARVKQEVARVNAAVDGDHRTVWAPRWAAETLRVARDAYRDVVLGAVTLDGPHDLAAIAITLVPDRESYLDRHASTATLQLARAAVRLAALLDRLP
jgi:hypothetical protein